jgi:hypothetical protein
MSEEQASYVVPQKHAQRRNIALTFKQIGWMLRGEEERGNSDLSVEWK